MKTLQNSPGFQLAYRNASIYDYFEFDASDFDDVVRVGFSQNGINDPNDMNIMINVANTTNLCKNEDKTFKSTIIHKNESVQEKCHGSTKPDITRSKIIVKIENGNITIKALNLSMEYEDPFIEKNKLNYLFVDSGSSSDGTWAIKGIVSKGIF